MQLTTTVAMYLEQGFITGYVPRAGRRRWRKTAGVVSPPGRRPRREQDGATIGRTRRAAAATSDGGRRRRYGRDTGLAAAIRQKPLGGVRDDVRQRPATVGAGATSDGRWDGGGSDQRRWGGSGDAARTLAWLLRSGKNRWAACVTTCGGDQRQ
nr:unnamed protein product [Digitaria exilis]